ncbi:MAG: hypothetical protein OXF25_10050 [Cyanobacteria bacterium MAG CAR3_bin_5]|nr:hypothetical protein [Cyanobacteria bacterium MAG CAR3_bin_5]
MPHNNSRHRSGGILALLTSSLLLAAGAALARPDCDDWNTREFFEKAQATDVALGHSRESGNPRPVRITGKIQDQNCTTIKTQFLPPLFLEIVTTG